MNWELFWPVLAALSIVMVVTLFRIGYQLAIHRQSLNVLIRMALADFESYARTCEKNEADREKANKKYNKSKISTRNNLEWNHSLMSCDLKDAEARQFFTKENLDHWIEWKQSQIDNVDEKLAEYSEEDNE